MPDWLIHLGIGYLLIPSRDRQDPRPLALGLVLPDLSIGLASALDKLGLTPPSRHAIELTTIFHTPLVVAVIAFLISRFFLNPGRHFLIMTGAAWLHCLLDTLQGKIGDGHMLLFPLSFQEFIITSYRWQDGIPALILQVAAGFLCLRWLRRLKYQRLLTPRVGRACLVSLIPLSLLCGIVLTQPARLNQSTAHHFSLMSETGTSLAAHPAHFNHCGVIWPSPLVVRYGPRVFTVVSRAPLPHLKRGDLLTLSGTTRGAYLYADYLRRLGFPKQKEWASILGFFFLVFVWLAFSASQHSTGGQPIAGKADLAEAPLREVK